MIIVTFGVHPVIETFCFEIRYRRYKYSLNYA
jgi:hypothetical protein